MFDNKVLSSAKSANRSKVRDLLSRASHSIENDVIKFSIERDDKMNRLLVVNYRCNIEQRIAVPVGDKFTVSDLYGGLHRLLSVYRTVENGVSVVESEMVRNREKIDSLPGWFNDYYLSGYQTVVGTPVSSILAAKRQYGDGTWYSIVFVNVEFPSWSEEIADAVDYLKVLVPSSVLFDGVK